MTKPDLLMPNPLLPMVMEQLDRSFTVHRLWETSDREATIAGLTQSCRYIATGAHGVVDAALMDKLPNLQIIANFGVGYDTVDAKAARERGIIVTNTPDVLTEEVADIALGLLIATARELPQAERYLRAGNWLKGPYPLTRGTLRDRSMGILGLGRIGKAIAERAEAFGIKVSYHGRSPQADVSYAYHPTLVGMAEAVDILMVVIPGGPTTRNIVDAAVLKALGPNGILINIARGTVVDEAALIEALRTKTILSAGLDVFAEEPRVPQALIDLDNAVLLPHVGSASQHTRAGMGQLVVDNLVAWKDGRGPMTPVPETPWPRP